MKYNSYNIIIEFKDSFLIIFTIHHLFKKYSIFKCAIEFEYTFQHHHKDDKIIKKYKTDRHLIVEFIIYKSP